MKRRKVTMEILTIYQQLKAVTVLMMKVQGKRARCTVCGQSKLVNTGYKKKGEKSHRNGKPVYKTDKDEER